MGEFVVVHLTQDQVRLLVQRVKLFHGQEFREIEAALMAAEDEDENR